MAKVIHEKGWDRVIPQLVAKKMSEQMVYGKCSPITEDDLNGN